MPRPEQSLRIWAKDDTYGYGWYLSSNVSGMTMCYHSGHNSGFNSFNAWVPNANLSMEAS